jgi:hypothetical protein
MCNIHRITVQWLYHVERYRKRTCLQNTDSEKRILPKQHSQKRIHRFRSEFFFKLEKSWEEAKKKKEEEEEEEGNKVEEKERK